MFESQNQRVPLSEDKPPIHPRGVWEGVRLPTAPELVEAARIGGIIDIQRHEPQLPQYDRSYGDILYQFGQRAFFSSTVWGTMVFGFGVVAATSGVVEGVVGMATTGAVIAGIGALTAHLSWMATNAFHGARVRLEEQREKPHARFDGQ